MIIAGFVFAFQSVAMADGIILPEVSVSGVASAVPVSQKALLWLRPDALELWIDSKFLRKDTGASWVVPLPENPQVKTANSKILDSLDAATRPVFMVLRYTYSGGGGGYGGGDVGASQEADITVAANGAEDSVFVWQSGSLGALDYVVISSKNGDSIVKWLTDHKYRVNDALKQGLVSEEAAGRYFFVARMSGPSKDGASLGAIRFIFPKNTPPFYPLQLTSMQIPENQVLNLLMFILWPLPYIPLPQPITLPELNKARPYTRLKEMTTDYEKIFSPETNPVVRDTPLLFFNEEPHRFFPATQIDPKPSVSGITRLSRSKRQ